MAVGSWNGQSRLILSGRGRSPRKSQYSPKTSMIWLKGMPDRMISDSKLNKRFESARNHIMIHLWEVRPPRVPMNSLTMRTASHTIALLRSDPAFFNTQISVVLGLRAIRRVLSTGSAPQDLSTSGRPCARGHFADGACHSARAATVVRASIQEPPDCSGGAVL